MLAFTLLAFEVLSSARGNTAIASAEYERARLSSAADAGVAAALAGLSEPDTANRWSIDGRRREMSFNNIALSITIEDEWGKIPVNSLDEDRARTMFETAGASGERLTTLVDSFEDWIDDDDDRRPSGAEAEDYAALGYKPRNGALRTIDELRLVKGMDDRLFARLAPALTVFFGSAGTFSPSTAQPLAIAVMTSAGVNSPAYLERLRELAGERPALDFEDIPLVGRALTVRVVARDGQDGSFTRAAIVQLTGNSKRPYWIRWLPQ
jgi:general secretion pathway protein K